MPQTILLLATILLTSLVPAFSHDLYMMPEKFVVTPGSRLRVVYQNGDEFPEGVSSVKPERLRNTRLISRKGEAPFANIVAEAARSTATVEVKAEGLAYLTSQTLPSLIELDPKKFTSYLEHENLTNVLKWREVHKETAKPGRERYSKYVKSLIQAGKPDDFFKHRTGLTIEIVPEADPYSLRVGATFPALVLFRGAPAVDVAVESAWLEGGKSKMEIVGRTDKSGRVQVPVKAIGPHRLHAIVMERCSEPAVADWESFWASLTYEIQKNR